MISALFHAALTFYRWCLILILVEIVVVALALGCWFVGDWIVNKIDWPRARGRRRRSSRS